ncbi:MAG: Carbamoyl-phosphate synthase small chain [Phycisphaerales bacterium]|nr:Carbamoyl-phosphate synthase small chain [Phycisphaerales bacterium]
MALVVFQHGDHVSPGRFGVTFRDHGFSLDIRRVDLPASAGGQPVPKDYDNVDGVLSLGGEQNIGDPHDWLDQEMAFIKGAHERNLPVIGICLGSQLIAQALGGKVEPMQTPEVGFHTVSINPTGQVDPLLAGIAWNSPQFCSHGYEIKQLPPGATLLASSKACKVQIFRAGLRTIGIQFHPECDRAMIDRFCSGCTLMSRAGLTASDVAAQAQKHYEMFARLADRLCVNLATLLLPSQSRR